MKRTLIAAAVLATAAGSAFAGPKTAFLFNATGVTEYVGIEGFVGLFGCVAVSSTAGAVINNTQNTGGGTLLPQAQSYQFGNVTTHYNDTNWSKVGTGTNSSYRTSYFAEGSASQSMSASSKTHDVSAWTATTSSRNSSFSKTFNAGIAANYHVATDSGNTSNSTTASTYSDTGHSNHSHSYDSVGSNTSTHSQNGSAGVQVGASWTRTGNFLNGSATFAASGSEGSSHTRSNSHNNSDSTATASTWSTANNRNTSNSSTNANTAYADGTGSAAVSAYANGTSGKSSNSSNTYNHHFSESSSSSHSHSQAYARATEERHTSGYSVNDTMKTVDDTTTGWVTNHIDTRKAATLDANTGNNAATGVTGNLGVNIAEGINNAQSNDVALASVDVGNVFGNAQIFNNQASAGTANVKNFNLNASVGDGSLASVSGNVGVNVASGIGNAQNNSLAGSVTTAKNAGSAQTTAMVATDNNVQNAGMTATGQFQGTASLGAGTLANASGNIGVNIAGGIGNLQHNGMAIAAMSNGH
ncbi:hypothetical protein PWR63_11455 [Paraburkholderia sp. A2WS-5]|uniref:hypothetical protein n=1 Tax=unclassified Paraburkholderia TaxID=2615204 RepID=UPI003B80979C